MLFASCSEKQEKVLLSGTGYVEDISVVESNPVRDVVFCEGSDIYMVTHIPFQTLLEQGQKPS